jgi:ribosomal protein S18 acetylase RimI-like enzyme
MIEQLGVKSTNRHNGVGRKLMELAEKVAKEKGCIMIVLDVWGFNENAIGFYNHLGFSERTRKLQKFI